MFEVQGPKSGMHQRCRFCKGRGKMPDGETCMQCSGTGTDMKLRADRVAAEELREALGSGMVPPWELGN